ncbi:unnamed protein product, partial [Ectocarpus sp. 12 AP-2014]
MIESILSNDATSSALYLRTLLWALDWAAKNAYDVRALLKNMLNTTTVGQLYNVFLDSLESGSNPTETTIRIAEQDNEAEGGKQALQDVIDDLGGEMPLNSNDSSAAAESHRGDNRHRQRQEQQRHSAVDSERPRHVNYAAVGVAAAEEGQASGKRASDKLHVMEGANDNSSEGNDCSEEGNEEDDAGLSEAEGDGYSEEEYEDSDSDETEEGEQEKVVRKNSPPEDGASSTKFQEAAMMDGINQEQGTDGASAQCDGSQDDRSLGSCDDVSMSRGEVGPGLTGPESTQNRTGNVFGVADEARTGGLPSRAFALSEVPLYLSGGTK